MEISKEKQERGFFWAYIAIGLVAIIGGLISVNAQINGIKPFLFSLDPTQGPIVTESQKRLQEIAEKRLQDSDNDTINDYDEEFVYRTSALLADTDSDGKADNEELEKGTDPNCAEDQVCFTTSTNTDVATESNTNGGSSIAGLDTSDPAALREQLIQLGVPKDVLDQVSDDDLVEVYSQVAQDSGVTSTTPVTTNTSNTNGDPYSGLLINASSTNAAQTVSDFQNLDSAGIRSLLVQSGMTEDDLSQIDDASLQALYQEALAQANEEQQASQ